MLNYRNEIYGVMEKGEGYDVNYERKEGLRRKMENRIYSFDELNILNGVMVRRQKFRRACGSRDATVSG